MRERERYYDSQQYDSAGIQPFLDHIAEFLGGERTAPVTRAQTVFSSDFVQITFTIEMYRLFLADFEKIRKPYECALKYGYRGYSKGGKNGVFNLRKLDVGLSLPLRLLSRREWRRFSRTWNAVARMCSTSGK